MSLIKWEPFEAFDKMFDDDLLTPLSSSPGWDLAIDMYEEKGNVIAEMNVPGLEADNIDVTVEDGLLRISGSREETKEKKEKQYYKKEIRRGSFERAVRLSCDVAEDKVVADYKNGVLKITLPKAKEQKQKKIKVKVSS
jgi:HSP20 family protein